MPADLHNVSSSGFEKERTKLAADEEEPSSDEQAGRVVVGTVVAFKADGERFPREDGEVLFRATIPGPQGKIERPTFMAKVAAGRFSLELPESFQGRSLVVHRMILGGKQAYSKKPPKGQRRRLSSEHGQNVHLSSSQVKLSAYWPSSLTFEVMDLATKSHLQGVRVASKSGGIHRPVPSHPGIEGSYKIELQEQDSPMVLDRMTLSDFLWVGASGYTWKSVRLGRGIPGEPIVVWLERGCTVSVRINGATELAKTTVGKVDSGVGPYIQIGPVRNAEVDGPYPRISAWQHWQGDREYRFDGLEPGALSISLTAPRATTSKGVLAKAETTIQAGEHQHVALDLDPDIRVGNPVRLKGKYYLPAAWGGPKGKLIFGPDNILGQRQIDIHQNKLVPIKGQPGWYSWDAGDVLPGNYVVSCMGGRPIAIHIARLEVPAQGLLDAEVVVPEPVEVHVTAVWKGSNEPVDLNDIGWRTVGVEGHPNYAQDCISKKSESGALVFRAPMEDILIFAEDPSYCGVVERLSPGPGVNHVRLELLHGCSVSILLEGDVPSNDLYRTLTRSVTIRAVDHNGKVQRYGRPVMLQEGQTYWPMNLSSPGAYEVQVAPIDGYELIESGSFEVEPGETASMTLRFVSK